MKIKIDQLLFKYKLLLLRSDCIDKERFYGGKLITTILEDLSKLKEIFETQK